VLEPSLSVVGGDEFESFFDSLVESLFGPCLGRAEKLFELKQKIP
jgi:hypothetical protein